MAQEGVFQTLIQDYGSSATQKEVPGDEQSEEADTEATETPGTKASEEKQQGGKLILDEERETGEVSWITYKHYLRAIGTYWWSLIIFSTLIAVEGSRAVNSLFLGFWSGRQLNGVSTGEYMAIYAGESLLAVYIVTLWLIGPTGLAAAIAVFMVSDPTASHDQADSSVDQLLYHDHCR